MPIIVVCHKCGTLATVPDSAAGMQGKCERCKNVIYVPGGAVKRCCACQVDVTHTERTKDAAGNYYCAQCTKTKQNAAEAEAAKASSTAEPGAASESAICVLCRAEAPKTILCNFDGDLVCHACAKKEGLGTTSYRKKKTRWGGRSIIYRCSQCQGDLESALDEAGKEDHCPQCGAAFDVPGRYEKCRASRPVPGSGGTTAVAAPPLGGFAPPPPATSRGRWLTVCASAVAAIMVSTFMVGYVVMKPNATPPQITTAAGQGGGAKAAGATQVAAGPAARAAARAGQAGGVPTKPAEANRAGVTAGVKAAVARAASAAAANARNARAAAHPWHKIGLPVRAGDAIVTLTAVEIRGIPLINIDGSAGESAHRLCEVFLSIHDASATRILHYHTWRGDVLGNHQGSLGDDAGNYYRQCNFGVGVKLRGQSRQTADVYPGKTVRDVLVFERPVAAAEVLQLRLPGGNIGWNHSLRFRFPARKAAGG